MGRLRMGIAGCGRVSSCHFAAVRANSRVMELAAVCDSDAGNLRAAVEATGARGYPSLSGMLDSGRLDAVAVCTPNWMHYENAREIISAGASAIVEKPLALSHADGRRLFDMAKRRGLYVFLIQQNRFNPTIVAARRALDRGAFGRLYVLSANVFWNRGCEYYRSSPWHGSKARDGGAFITQGSHYADIMDWFSGAPLKEVYAVGRTLAREIETEDAGCALMEWKNGVLGSLNLSVLAYGGDYEGSLAIQGEKGLVKIGGVALNRIIDWKFEGRAPRPDVSYRPDSVYGFGHVPYYKAVADTLLKGVPFVIPPAAALASIRLLEAIGASMARGEPVRFK